MAWGKVHWVEQEDPDFISLLPLTGVKGCEAPQAVIIENVTVYFPLHFTDELIEDLRDCRGSFLAEQGIELRSLLWQALLLNSTAFKSLKTLC